MSNSWLKSIVLLCWGAANPGKTINIYESIQQKVAEELSRLWIGDGDHFYFGG
ncbi:MAG: hypothetical protein NTU79_04400 [Planctomycetota bacterium]|nr:hypothetical protein [Planctomycetota bacterium]